MDRTGRNTAITDKLYIAAYFVCLLAFTLPANNILIGGQAHTQYLLTSYVGWTVLSVIIFLFGLQWLALLKNNKWLSWPGVVAGLYCLGYAGTIILKRYQRFNTSMTDSLVKKLEAKNIPLPGLWLLAVGGLMLFTIAIIKLVKKQQAVLPGSNT